MVQKKKWKISGHSSVTGIFTMVTSPKMARHEEWDDISWQILNWLVVWNMIFFMTFHILGRISEN